MTSRPPLEPSLSSQVPGPSPKRPHGRHWGMLGWDSWFEASYLRFYMKARRGCQGLSTYLSCLVNREAVDAENRCFGEWYRWYVHLDFGQYRLVSWLECPYSTLAGPTGASCWGPSHSKRPWSLAGLVEEACRQIATAFVVRGGCTADLKRRLLAWNSIFRSAS